MLALPPKSDHESNDKMYKRPNFDSNISERQCPWSLKSSFLIAFYRACLTAAMTLDRAPSIAESTHSAVSNASGNTSRTGNNVASRGDAPPSAGGKPTPKRAGKTYLAVTIVVWYVLTVLYSVYNTAVLQVFPFPLTVLSVELFAGVLLILPAWILGIIRTPNLKLSQVKRVYTEMLKVWKS